MLEQCLCERRDGTVEQHGAITVLRCKCGISRLRTQQSVEEVELQYEDGSYHESEQRHANCVPYAQRYSNDEIAAGHRMTKYKRILNGRFEPGATVLDVGCANGAFVDVARSRGYLAWGLDPHPVGGDNHLLLTGSLIKLPPELKDARFSVITYHDVLEHLVDPVAELLRARAMLVPRGTIIVDVPDVSSPLGQHHWKQEHLWYFSGLSLAQLFERVGLTAMAIDAPIPGKLVVYGTTIR